MNSKIFVLNEDNRTLTSLDEGPFENEDIFQELLERYPDLLAGDQMNPSAPRRWLLVSREYGVPGAEDEGDRWSLDHLFIDHEGIPTLVEVKRASDTRARREVVAQMLDYAANGVVYWPVERIRSKYESTCAARGDDATTLASVLQCGPDDADAIEAFWSLVETNLKAGRIRMVFVADQIHPELRRIIEFLNGQMERAEVMGIEIRHYRGNGIRTLVPQIVGVTAQTQGTKAKSLTPRIPWTEETFFPRVLEQSGKAAHDVSRAILDWALARGLEIYWGKGTNDSFTPLIVEAGQKYWLFSPSANGRVYISFNYLKAMPPFDRDEMREEVRVRLNRLGAQIAADRISRQPTIEMAALAEPATLAGFLEVLNWIIDMHRRHDEDSAQRSGGDQQ
ncbi:MAG TPA: hypothetical protein VM493_11070 [Vicinamibacterales bacterium]|jgi:hypothetical protein|nr:hypothetical protein [Vicinamibacterales bacterium]